MLDDLHESCLKLCTVLQRVATILVRHPGCDAASLQTGPCRAHVSTLKLSGDIIIMLIYRFLQVTSSCENVWASVAKYTGGPSFRLSESHNLVSAVALTTCSTECGWQHQNLLYVLSSAVLVN
jgi:hypothetical protein